MHVAWCFLPVQSWNRFVRRVVQAAYRSFYCFVPLYFCFQLCFIFPFCFWLLHWNLAKCIFLNTLPFFELKRSAGFHYLSRLFSLNNMQSLDINGRSFSYILVIFPSIYMLF
jgi:hypothetical protein